MSNNRISAYHHGLAFKDGEFYKFEDKSLPPLNVSPEKQQLANNPRKILSSDLLDKNILILYRNEQVALQCLQAQLLLIDQIEFRCDNITLQWFGVPEMIRDKESGTILSTQTHFRNELLSWDLKDDYNPPDINTLLIKKFQESHLEKIRTFFTDTSPKRITFFSGLGVLVILILCSPLIYFLWTKPRIPNKVSTFCCGLKNPLLYWKVKAEHKAMSHRLEEIQKEQSVPLNQTNQSKG